MKSRPVVPARRFKVGHPGREITLHHALDVDLDPDEQVTLHDGEGGEFDVVRKEWGYYATPSLNGRLVSFGYRSALCRSGTRRYVMVVRQERIDAFKAYLSEQGMSVIAWLDGDEIEWLEEADGDE